MKPPNITAAARCAKDVAHKVGVFLKSQLRTPKHINLQTAHDIKLELDNRSQRDDRARPAQGLSARALFSARKARWAIPPASGVGWWIPSTAR